MTLSDLRYALLFFIHQQRLERLFAERIIKYARLFSSDWVMFFYDGKYSERFVVVLLLLG